MKAIEQYFPVVLYITQYKVGDYFLSLWKRNHSNETLQIQEYLLGVFDISQQ